MMPRVPYLSCSRAIFRGALIWLCLLVVVPDELEVEPLRLLPPSLCPTMARRVLEWAVNILMIGLAVAEASESYAR
jgi:hypothetical protein